MKKLRKLTVALLAAVMLLSLTAPAFALRDGDPNECPFCGIGTYEERLGDWIGFELGNRVKCSHNWEGCWDGDLIAVYSATMSCSNTFCSQYNYTPIYQKRVNMGRICTHEYTGMSLGGELS